MFMKQGNKTKKPMLTVRMTEKHKDYLKAAAKAEGLTLSAWTIATLNRAAKQVLSYQLNQEQCLDNIYTEINDKVGGSE